ncbi:MAG: MmcQ/YjbR family DNA-binding protein [Xanthomonadales bacterium]|nr:MmcQ/YjbR family DNA-binding protein [Xanthomonadales bacterium]
MHDDVLLRLAGRWPGVTADVKWDVDRVLSVAGKMFCALALEGPKKGQLSFKVDPDRFLEYTDRPGIHPAAYLARAHWVSVAPLSQPGEPEIAGWLAESYALVASKLPAKVRRELGLAHAAGDIVRSLSGKQND